MTAHAATAEVRRVTLVCAVLVAATALSWWAGSDRAAGEGGRWLSTGLVLIAIVKCRLVIRYFMEVHGAALALRIATDLWCLAVLGSVTVLPWVVR